MACRSQLLLQLCEFRPASNVVGPELLIFRISRQGERQIVRTNRAHEVVADEYAQRAGRHFFIYARTFKLVAALDGLQLRAGEVDRRDLSTAQQERNDALELFG